MKKHAFLIDVSEQQDSNGKYLILVQILALMLKGLMNKPENHRYMVSYLTEDGVAEIVEQFHAAFSDLEGIEMQGLAKITTRLFLNIRGFELSVWTAQDDHYTIFVSTTSNQISSTIKKLTNDGFKDVSAYKKLLADLIEIEHSLVFPKYKDIKKQYSND